MQDITPKIIAILQKYIRNSAVRIGGTTILNELEIDFLDLQMIFLDVEEAFDVQIRDEDDIEVAASVSGLTQCVTAHLQAKRSQPRTPVRRPKRSWVSTGAERRR